MNIAVKIFALVCALALLPAPAVAQSYPSKPVKLVVGAAPGGGTDNLARLLAPRLAERLGQSVVVENKAGAQGMIAQEYVAKAEPDGYTLLVGTDGMVLNVGLYKKVPFDPVKDYAPITRLSSNPMVFAVHPSVPANTLKEFIALAKAKPKSMFYASGAPVFYVTTELLKKEAGIDIEPVQYKGAAPAVTAAIAGETQFVTSSVGPLVAHLRAGKLRALAMTGHERNGQIPDVPTMAEAGVADFFVVPWTGLFAPAGTPPEIVEKISREMNVVLKQEDLKARFAKLGVDLGGMTPAEFGNLVKADLAKWPRLLREFNISVK